jgi:hypothetical protein
VGTSENDFNDFYHDDPAPQLPKNKLPSKFIATGALILGSILFFQGTFAGNISLNSGRGIEFGQAILQAVACSGNTDLTLTPYSSFTNTAESGTHYLERITVSNIPTECRGADFTIRAYNDASNTPLSLFNTNSNAATIQTIDTPGTSNDSGTAWAGAAGMSVSASTTGDAFTITFTTPAASSSDVAKITLESNKPYYYGGPGGGGGTIFYVSTTGFNCGPAFTARCKYLEAAPVGWNGGSEPTKKWATGTASSGNAIVDVAEITNEMSANNTSAAIGLGYKNSVAIVDQGNDATTAAGAARAYQGGSKNDWYLPALVELNQMCKWQKGKPWTSDLTICVGGSYNSGPGAAGFETGTHLYYSSSEANATLAWYQDFSAGTQGGPGKSLTYLVRPIRAL